MRFKCTIKLTLLLMYLSSTNAFSIDNGSFVKLADKKEISSIINLTLHSSNDKETSSLEYLAFNIPFPPGHLASSEKYRLIHKGNELSYFSEPTLWWKNSQNNSKHSIRSLRILIKNDNIVFPYNLSFEITANKAKSLKQPNNIKIFKTSYHAIRDPSSGTEKILDINIPYIYPTFTNKWLSKCLLRSKSLPLNANKKLKWFDLALINFTDSFINAISDDNTKNHSISLLNAEPWMYDLPATLFNAYFKTGKLEYLQQAHITSQVYAKLLNQQGHFTLKSRPDLKYSYNTSLLLDFILLGDENLIEPIEAVAKFTSNWKISYKIKDTFWTERHQTYSLLGSLGAWEATGKSYHLDNAIKIAKATMHSAKNPENGWEPQGCVLHTIRAHEGDPDDRPVCSPWMSALLSEAMFRYYIQTSDVQALTFLYDLANFTTTHGIYEVSTERHMNGMHVPWYLASKGIEYTDNGPWDDREHACDVAGLLARGNWAGMQLKMETQQINSALKNMLYTCEKTFGRWHRTSKTTKNKFWKNAPARKYNWWFGSTSDLTYFYQY